MRPSLSRRELLIVSAGAAGFSLLPTTAAAEKSPALPQEMVREFVIAGHADLDKVKTMLAAQPGLLNATWDWGGGDFEMAIGGAGHMGRPDIASYLIDKGGRFDLFVAAMLGRLEIVKPMLTAWPALKDSKGPHGLTLMHHAKQGKEAAAPVLAFLEAL